MKPSTKKLKIGIVLDDSLDRNDGVQQYVRSLGGWLSKQGHSVHYLAGQTEAKNVHSLSKNIGVKFNGNRLTIPLPAKTAAIKALLSKESYDVLHVQMPYSPFMAGKVIKYASAQTAVVGTFHILPFGTIQRHGNKALAVVQKSQFKRFDAICSVSSAAQMFAKSHYNLTSTVIPNMIDTASWHSPVPIHSKRMVYLGRLVPRKGCMELLKAVARLPEPLRSEVEVLIAGDGPERSKLEQYVKRNHLTNVSFLGYIDEIQKPHLLASAELAVFPSLGGESFGIVLIEAMAADAGVVLGGNNDGYSSVLKAWPQTLFNPKDTASFVACIEMFLTDKSFRNKFHTKQQVQVKQYDVNVVGEQIMQMYQSALLHRHQDVR